LPYGLREQRLAIADDVIVNTGSLQDLQQQVGVGCPLLHSRDIRVERNKLKKTPLERGLRVCNDCRRTRISVRAAV
jgi:hypothetical protein